MAVVPRETPRLGELYELWLGWARVHVREGTVQTKAESLSRWMKLVGDVPVDQISKKTISEYKSKAIRQKYSPVTVNITLRDMRSLVNVAIEEGWLDIDNPFTKFRPLPVDKRLPKYINRDQLDRLLTTAKKMDTWNLTAARFIALGAFAGLRRREILAARWEWVKGWGSANPHLHLQEGLGFRLKDAEERAIPIFDSLRPHLARRRREGYIVFPDLLDPAIRFQFGRRKGIYKVYRSAGMPVGFSTHWLRHTFASLLLATGQVQMHELKEWMGHSSIDTTMIYSHLIPRDGIGSIL